ncbi:hypothetical protein C8Q76DRAFT_616774, partial [Earliella scabrosa]
DFSTHDGLSQLHQQFDRIYQTLDSTFVAAYRYADESVMGGILGIMEQMCADVTLLRKLYNKGFLVIVAAALKNGSTAAVSLHVLEKVAHHGGQRIKSSVLALIPDIIVALGNLPNDTSLAKLTILTVSHVARGYCPQHDRNPYDFDQHCTEAIAELAVKLHRSRGSTYRILDIALDTIVNLVQTSPRHFDAAPTPLSLLIACLRSEYLPTRAKVAGALLRYPRAEQPALHRASILRFFGGMDDYFPNHLAHVFDEYGGKMECVVRAQTHLDWIYAMGEVRHSKDLRKFGTTLSRLLRLYDRFMPPPGWTFRAQITPLLPEHEERDSWVNDAPDLTIPFPPSDSAAASLPFSEGLDAFPHCAKALRENGSPEDLDDADILDISYALLDGDLDEAVKLAQEAIKRNPHLTYAHYVSSLGDDPEASLSAAERGMSCTDVTVFERCQMLWAMSMSCIREGLPTTGEARSSKTLSEESRLKFLRRGLHATRTYLEVAPPDARHMLSMLGWYVLLDIILRGPAIQNVLDDFTDIRTHIDVSSQLMTLVGDPYGNCQVVHLAAIQVLQNYDDSARVWGSMVRRFDTQYEERRGSTGNRQYLCSWCKQPLSVLRKCTGCRITRYCDTVCQAGHWPQHKLDCATWRDT